MILVKNELKATKTTQNSSKYAAKKCFFNQNS